MRFSLITATLGRRDEVARLFESLAAQTFHDFELILVDQNSDGKLDDIVAEFSQKFILTHIKSAVKGLSYNRNIGLKIARGEIVAFPDDDCFYSPDLLFNVNKSFLAKESFKLRLAAIGDPSTKEVYMPGKRTPVKRSDLMKYAISFNLFIRRSNSMRFDPLLGCGAPFGSGEESDFLWENMNNKDAGIFVDSTVYHPQGTASYRNNATLYSYGLGWGAIYKKECFTRRHPLAIIPYCYGIIRCIGGILLTSEKRSYYNTLKGRIKGFITFPLNK